MSRAIACAAGGFLALSLNATVLYGQPAPKRLSDWLLDQPASANSYPLGLSWQVPDEVIPQTARYLDLMQDLSGLNPDVKADRQSLIRLRTWLRTLPVTGRVKVPLVDARWLQANPSRDPILRPGHGVILPARPHTVTVVTALGDRCQVAHVQGREARAYVDACYANSAGEIDWAWLAQPDGRIQRYGISSWNRQEQDEPSPGTWIWAPLRTDLWPDEVSFRLISFLATQGPAPDQSSDPLALGVQDIHRSVNAETSSGDWGGLGLLQTPTARMRRAGSFSASLSRVAPYSQANIFVQPFDWLEAGFRYTTVSNRLYGPAVLSGDQSYKDKSIDAKFRLLQESAYTPELAIGFRDLAGTGLFSGEYIVANKRTGDFDWSLGMGWGYVGGRGNISNPLGRIARSFNTRRADFGQGGNFGFGNYFRGPASLFGGVQYRTPWKSVVFKAEFDGNNYQNEPLGNNQKQDSPLNFGLVYKASRYFDLSLGIERGNTVMFGLALHAELDKLETPKPNDPPRIPVAPTRPTGNSDWAATSRDLLTQTEWRVRKIEQQGGELRVTIDEPEALYLRDREDKAAAVLHRDAPASVDRFVFAFRQRGIDIVEHVLDREDWVRQKTELRASQAAPPPTVARESAKFGSASESPLYESKPPRFESGLGFDYQQTLGGPDAFVLFQISAVERAKFRIRDDTWLQGSLRLGLIDNYDKFKYTAPSNLPRVRTFLREYLTSSALTMPNLQATHVGKIGNNQFYSVYAGYLESMFGGVGAEWLYKPLGSRLSYGVDVNAVRQRNFTQDFGFQSYKVVTGHATIYWDTGWQDVQARVSVGRYLAKDFGATLELSRTFKNGVTIGAFATKTNVSSAEFGEGSFDKGLFLSIPFDAMLTRSSNSVAGFVWKPLTRDGGAMLARANTLHALTGSRTDRALWYEPAPRPNEYLMPADRREEWEPKAGGPTPTLQILSRPTSAAFTPGSILEHRLVEELYRQDFRNIQVSYDASHRLSIIAANDSLFPVSRAAGRAVRTALRHSPIDTREIKVTLVRQDTPVVTYDFLDMTRLEKLMGGALDASELSSTVTVRYLDPSFREEEPFRLLSDIDTTDRQPSVTEVIPGIRTIHRIGTDFAAAGTASREIDWLRAGALGGGLVFASSVADKHAFKYAAKHANARWLKAAVKVGDALPWVGIGAAGLLALGSSDSDMRSAGLAASEAGGVAFLAATGLKYVVGRARPETGLGPHDFKPGSSQDAFPSRHAMVAWAVATPFAEQYQANWLYGAAALTSLARVGSQKHWVSDAVAGSLLGYGIGRMFWESNRNAGKGARFSLSPAGVSVGWLLD